MFKTKELLCSEMNLNEIGLQYHKGMQRAAHERYL